MTAALNALLLLKNRAIPTTVRHAGIAIGAALNFSIPNPAVGIRHVLCDR